MIQILKLYFLELWYLLFPAECSLCQSPRSEESFFFCQKHQKAWNDCHKEFSFCSRCGDEKCPDWFCFRNHLNPVPWARLRIGAIYIDFFQKLINRLKSQKIASSEELFLYEGLEAKIFDDLSLQGHRQNPLGLSLESWVFIAIPSSSQRFSLNLGQRWASYLAEKKRGRAFSLAWHPKGKRKKQAFRSQEDRFLSPFSEGRSYWICLQERCFPCAVKRGRLHGLLPTRDCKRVRELKSELRALTNPHWRIQLVDDVMTTGETARSFLECLAGHLELFGLKPKAETFYCLGIRRSLGAVPTWKWPKGPLKS